MAYRGSCRQAQSRRICLAKRGTKVLGSQWGSSPLTGKHEWERSLASGYVREGNWRGIPTMVRENLKSFAGGSGVPNLPANAQVRSLVQEDPTCLSNWAHVPQLLSLRSRAGKPQLLKPARPRAHTRQEEKPPQWEAQAPQLGSSPCLLQLQKSLHSNEDPIQSEINT